MDGVDDPVDILIEGTLKLVQVPLLVLIAGLVLVDVLVIVVNRDEEEGTRVCVKTIKRVELDSVVCELGLVRTLGNVQVKTNHRRRKRK